MPFNRDDWFVNRSHLMDLHLYSVTTALVRFRGRSTSTPWLTAMVSILINPQTNSTPHKRFHREQMQIEKP